MNVRRRDMMAPVRRVKNLIVVLDALISLFCRTSISADALWDGGWLLRQLLPYSETEFNSHHLESLKDAFAKCCIQLVEEQRGSWPDLLIQVLCDEWRKCKRAIEASSPRKEPKSILFPPKKASSSDVIPIESSFAAGEMMYERVKVFVLLHQLQIFSTGRSLPDQPPILPLADFPERSRAKSAALNIFGPKLSTELHIALDPRTWDVIADVAEGDAEDIDRAGSVARKAFDEGPCPKMTAYVKN
ncbi:hypothetical protein E3N88_40238 [Mikania micrantha]|uniref:Uncharacterized protein n=1 Tax=Mikania micrantha TaxID=192012 RepID=A0A5N6LM45_9ASTR|nr:hypothetical protein E3N88_40234 [Mikania micrantha]KAD2393261.1 hypothetical protein E3N88_40238 [Mikania micrantha]